MSTHAQFLSALNAIFDETSCKLKLQHIQSYIVMLPRVLDWLPVQSLRPPCFQSRQVLIMGEGLASKPTPSIQAQVNLNL